MVLWPVGPCCWPLGMLTPAQGHPWSPGRAPQDDWPWPLGANARARQRTHLEPAVWMPLSLPAFTAKAAELCAMEQLPARRTGTKLESTGCSSVVSRDCLIRVDANCVTVLFLDASPTADLGATATNRCPGAAGLCICRQSCAKVCCRVP